MRAYDISAMFGIPEHEKFADSDIFCKIQQLQASQLHCFYYLYIKGSVRQ